MLRWRLSLGAILIGGIVALGYFDHKSALPGAWLMPLLIIITILATDEVLRLFRAAGLDPVAWPVHVGNLAVVAGTWVGWCANLSVGDTSAETTVTEAVMQIPPAGWALAGLGAALLLIFIGEMRRYEKPGGVIANLSAAAMTVFYVGLPLAVLIDLRMRWGLAAVASIILVVKMGDTGAYTIGRLFGRHKMAPTLSPGKTIEGAFGAFTWAVAGAFIGLNLVTPGMGGEASTVAQWIIFGLLVGAAGMLGDLAESLIKRDAGRKDSSTWLPGFGGVMDLMDSILLAAPIAWLLLAAFSVF